MEYQIALINQLFDMQQRLKKEELYEKFERNFNRIESLLEEQGLVSINPEGESYSDSRTDCEANIIGQESVYMRITRVIKPIVYRKGQGKLTLVQKGIVIVEAQ